MKTENHQNTKIKKVAYKTGKGLMQGKWRRKWVGMWTKTFKYQGNTHKESSDMQHQKLHRKRHKTGQRIWKNKYQAAVVA